MRTLRLSPSLRRVSTLPSPTCSQPLCGIRNVSSESDTSRSVGCSRLANGFEECPSRARLGCGHESSPVHTWCASSSSTIRSPSNTTRQGGGPTTPGIKLSSTPAAGSRTALTVWRTVPPSPAVFRRAPRRCIGSTRLPPRPRSLIEGMLDLWCVAGGILLNAAIKGREDWSGGHRRRCRYVA